MNEKTLIRHLIWMCRNMPNREDNPYKWNRWLGFVQGGCVSLGMASIEQFMAVNKRSLNEGLTFAATQIRNRAETLFGPNIPFLSLAERAVKEGGLP